MAAGTWNFTLEQGVTFTKTLTWKDAEGVLVPLVGLTARMHIRAKITDAEPLLELTTENGGITLTSPGVIDLLIDSEASAALSFKTAVYDLEIVTPVVDPDPDIVERLLQGTITLSKEVTREPVVP